MTPTAATPSPKPDELKIVLKLTSPSMVNDQVRQVQRALKRRGYKTLRVDGDYGKVTASTVAHWKRYKAGYPLTMVNQMVGKTAWGHLVLDKPINKGWLKEAARRRAELAAAADAVPKAEKAVALMEKWAKKGYHERTCPSHANNRSACTNYVPELAEIGKELGVGWEANMHYPWCAYCALLAGALVGIEFCIDGLLKDKFNALYCPTIRAKSLDGYKSRNINRSECRRGDLLIINFPGGDANADHIVRARGGFDSNGYIKTAEGNTSPEGGSGSQANGGGCYLRTRHISQVSTIIREEG